MFAARVRCPDDCIGIGFVIVVLGWGDFDRIAPAKRDGVAADGADGVAFVALASDGG